jgi:site-specific recombinase XerD
VIRDLANFLDIQRGKQDWATVNVSDIDSFLATQPKNRQRRLVVLRQFFRFARTRRIVLVDPTSSLNTNSSKGFRGRTLTIDEQRVLFRRWTADLAAHPYRSPTSATCSTTAVSAPA